MEIIELHAFSLSGVEDVVCEMTSREGESLSGMNLDHRSGMAGD